ncbi:MAG: hypothetical protein CVU48_08590 [Candidatus Cloacimonetes bacterium HGW-Cloacimonetes-1]|jgi:hypothetical protein|nr:MAG: hypothetical protein CVU48_08590 [Candidatus Cloacimonetes bacterium HGW-Cloacimonetes-1]
MEQKKSIIDWKTLLVSTVMATLITVVVHLIKGPCLQPSNTPICDIVVNFLFWVVLIIVFYLFKKMLL